jgi:hypothetical protein
MRNVATEPGDAVCEKPDNEQDERTNQSGDECENKPAKSAPSQHASGIDDDHHAHLTATPHLVRL